MKTKKLTAQERWDSRPKCPRTGTDDISHRYYPGATKGHVPGPECFEHCDVQRFTVENGVCGCRGCRIKRDREACEGALKMTLNVQGNHKSIEPVPCHCPCHQK